MANEITDEMIDYVGILAKLQLSSGEREQAKADMAKMLDYVDLLSELDTFGVEPMSHVFPAYNVFREDVPEKVDMREAIMSNAPDQRNGSFVVPGTVRQKGEEDEDL